MNDISTENLERIKLQREIAELERPVWKRPAFLGVLGPTLLAAASLGLGFWTGLFDLERKRLENDKTLLELQRYETTKTLEEEQAKLEIAKSDVERAQSDVISLETRLKTREAEINAELAQQQKAFETEKSMLRGELAVLSQTLKDARLENAAKLEKLNSSITKARSQLQQLEVNLKHAETDSLLKSMREHRTGVWGSQATKKLIERASRSASTKARIESKLSDNLDPKYHSGLLYLLYQVDKTPERFSAFTDFLAENSDNVDVWKLFAWGYWPAALEVPILDRLLLAAQNDELSDATLPATLNFFRRPKIRLSQLRTAFKTDAGAAYAAKAWERSLRPRQSYHIHVTALAMSSAISPKLGLAHYSLLLDTNKMSDTDSVRLGFRNNLEALLRVSSRYTTEYRSMNKFLSSQKLPSWTSDEEIEKLKPAIKAGDLPLALKLVNG